MGGLNTTLNNQNSLNTFAYVHLCGKIAAEGWEKKTKKLTRWGWVYVGENKEAESEMK